MNTKEKFSRRDFLKYSAIGAAGALLVPGSLSAAVTPAAAPAKEDKKPGANDALTLGFIGLGQQAMYLLNGFLTIPGVKVVAGCDVYDIKRNRFAHKVKTFYDGRKERSDVKVYERYQDLLARADIDAVVIATPDHHHAHIAIAACKAGKNVYLEKPLTLTIFEGQELRRTVRETGRILQVGSQQRSSPEFIHAANLVREGRLGKVNLMKAYVGAPPTPYNLPKETVPAGLNWDLWLGPLPETIHYNQELNPMIEGVDGKEKIWGAWRWYKEMGGGFTTDWGAHMFDIGQWAIGKDRSGPVEILPATASPFDAMTFIYDNGVKLLETKFDKDKKGIKIYGENGWIQVCRGEFLASSPEFMPAVQQKTDDMPYETRIPHLVNFVTAVRKNVDPNVPVEVGHSSCTLCTLGNIATDLNRPVKWNPIVEKFNNDPEATKLLHYKYRNGYSLL